MARSNVVLLCGVLLLAGRPASAADNPAAGTWKFNFLIQGQRGPVDLAFLVMFSEDDKGWVGDLLGMSIRSKKEPKIEKLTVQDDHVAFSMKIDDEPISFDGRIAKDGKKILGTIKFISRTFFVELVPSKLKNLEDKFAVMRETLAHTNGSPEYFDMAIAVLTQAGAKKLKPEDVRGVADAALKTAESYGPRWQRSFMIRVSSTLADQEAYVPIALELARQVERMLKPDDEAAVQMEILEAVAQVFKKAKKLDELKPLESRLAKLEARDYADYTKKNPPFKADEFKGRTAKSDRVVLVELFTGADCPPCVAADLACDALATTYKPTEVTLLEYHVPANGPDPLANAEGLDRAKFYEVEAAPLIFFNGKQGPGGGGTAAASKEKYGIYRKSIDELLDKPAGTKLQLSASQKGNDIIIKANVDELESPGEKTVLRFALVEERVRYQGNNGLRYQHSVVRSLPGGVKGTPLTKKSSEHTAAVNLDKLRADLLKGIEKLAVEDGFTNPNRPLELRNLRVVAFVQNDVTNEVLQAAQVEIEEKKGE